MKSRRLLLPLALLLAGIVPTAAAAAPGACRQGIPECAGGPGAVRLVRANGGSATPAQEAFVRDRIWRVHGLGAWHSGTWVHRSAYALVPGSPEAVAHPEWILKDASGNWLWTGSSYAADFGNPAYRAWWIGQAATQATGHRGLYIDDVSMQRRVTYSWGSNATPRDPRTLTSMSEAKWQRYLADFMVEVRASLPGLELVHDVLWFRGDAGFDIRRALDAADHVAIERGFNDPIVTSGAGTYGWQSLAGFVERRQAAGRGVVLDGYADTAAGRLYGLGNLLLLDAGGAALGNDAATAPGAFWGGYDVQLGNPLTPRYASDGVWRRDFAGGVVLVNEPGQPARTVVLPAGLEDLDGIARETVTLPAASAAVLVRRPNGPPPPPPVSEPVTPVAPVVTPTPRTPVKRSSGKGGKAHIAGAAGPGKTTTTANVAALRVYGRVRGAVGGSVQVVVQRSRRGRWTTVRREKTSVSRRGSFESRIARLPKGRYRVSAKFLGTGTALPSRSGYNRRSI